MRSDPYRTISLYLLLLVRRRLLMKVELRQVRHQQAMGRELGFAFATLVYFPRRHLHNRIHGRLKAMIRAQNNQERNRKTKFQCPKSREYPAAIHTTSSTTLSPHSATS